MFSFVFTGHCIGRATFGAYSYLSGRGNGIGFIAAKHFAASNFGKWFSAAYKARKGSQKAKGRGSYEDTILPLQNNSSLNVIPAAMKPLLNWKQQNNKTAKQPKMKSDISSTLKFIRNSKSSNVKKEIMNIWDIFFLKRDEL